MGKNLVAMALIIGLGMTPAFGQANNRVTGTIETFDGKTLMIRSSNGEVSVGVPEATKVGAVVDRSLDDIKQGSFVGSAAVEGPDGKLHAQEVHIFPEPMRGTGEGHHPMSEPKQTMTNATVAQVVASPAGRVLQLRYKDGEQSIQVDPGTRIVELVSGDRSLLKPGAAVVVFLAKADNGSLSARFIQAEKDGVKPLM